MITTITIIIYLVYRWYHICFTYNHTDHNYLTYIDGQLVYEMTYDIGRPIYGDYARLRADGKL